jgi:CheY-like chemotaxis protein
LAYLFVYTELNKSNIIAKQAKASKSSSSKAASGKANASKSLLGGKEARPDPSEAGKGRHLSQTPGCLHQSQIAKTLGYGAIANLLEQTLAEEKKADEKLTGLAFLFVNNHPIFVLPSILAKQFTRKRTMKRNVPYILLADDDPDDQELLTLALLKEIPDVVVESVTNGDQVLTWLEACSPVDLPALIVLDYKMPVFTAPEVLQRLAANYLYAGISTFVWSTSGRTEDIDHCIKFGAAAYFTKPNTDLELTGIIQNIAQAIQGHLSSP